MNDPPYPQISPDTPSCGTPHSAVPISQEIRQYIYKMAASESLTPPTPRLGLRRLSSMTATPRDLTKGGPVVVVPERLMTQSTNSHHGGFAASMETARQELSTMDLEEEALASPTASTPITTVDMPTTDSFAFAFDIDGVLIRGGRPIPEAVEAMRVLNGANEYGIKV
jgi:hypothetical protein